MGLRNCGGGSREVLRDSAWGTKVMVLRNIRLGAAEIARAVWKEGGNYGNRLMRD